MLQVEPADRHWCDGGRLDLAIGQRCDNIVLEHERRRGGAGLAEHHGDQRADRSGLACKGSALRLAQSVNAPRSMTVSSERASADARATMLDCSKARVGRECPRRAEGRPTARWCDASIACRQCRCQHHVAHKGNTIVSDSCSRKRLLRCEPTAAAKGLACARDVARAGMGRLMNTKSECSRTRHDNDRVDS